MNISGSKIEKYIHLFRLTPCMQTIIFRFKQAFLWNKGIKTLNCLSNTAPNYVSLFHNYIILIGKINACWLCQTRIVSILRFTCEKTIMHVRVFFSCVHVLSFEVIGIFNWRSLPNRSVFQSVVKIVWWISKPTNRKKNKIKRRAFSFFLFFFFNYDTCLRLSNKCTCQSFWSHKHDQYSH